MYKKEEKLSSEVTPLPTNHNNMLSDVDTDCDSSSESESECFKRRKHSVNGANVNSIAVTPKTPVRKQYCTQWRYMDNMKSEVVDDEACILKALKGSRTRYPYCTKWMKDQYSKWNFVHGESYQTLRSFRNCDLVDNLPILISRTDGRHADIDLATPGVFSALQRRFRAQER